MQVITLGVLIATIFHECSEILDFNVHTIDNDNVSRFLFFMLRNTLLCLTLSIVLLFTIVLTQPMGKICYDLYFKQLNRSIWVGLMIKFSINLFVLKCTTF